MGEVVEVGALVRDFKCGDRVIIPAITPDWGALESQAGYSMHSGGMLAGWKFSNFKDGVFAEFFHVNEADANMAHLPADVDPVAAVMLADMVRRASTAWSWPMCSSAMMSASSASARSALMSVAGAALHGAAQLFAVGSRPVCAEAARRYGATEILNYREGDIVAQVMEKTNGRGVDA